MRFAINFARITAESNSQSRDCLLLQRRSFGTHELDMDSSSSLFHLVDHGGICVLGGVAESTQVVGLDSLRNIAKEMSRNDDRRAFLQGDHIICRKY